MFCVLCGVLSNGLPVNSVVAEKQELAEVLTPPAEFESPTGSAKNFKEIPIRTLAGGDEMK